MDNLKFLQNTGWTTWSTPYSRDRVIKSVQALDIVNEVVEWIAKGRGTGRIPRPRVVVVGEQGCGKSSVLESFIGSGFLPKGLFPGGQGAGDAVNVENKLKTTCPVVINLVKCQRAKHCRHTFWATFDHDVTTPKKCFYELEDIEKEIEERMEFLSSQIGNGVSEEELAITYYSSEVAELTLIDLPGLSLNSTGVVQDSELDSSIQKLVLKYISQPDTLILAVTLATTYAQSSSPILDFVRGVDPKEKRTLAVFSFWDQLSSDWQGRKIVLGQTGKKMDLGVVGIRNRTPTEVMKKTPVQDMQLEAEHYIMTHDKELTSVMTGIGVGPRYLVERVCEVVIYMWASTLRSEKTTMNTVLNYVKHKLEKREELLRVGYVDGGGRLAKLIKSFKYFVAVIEKDWEDFGSEGSITRHQELSQQFRQP